MFKALRSVDFKPAGLLLYSKAAHYTPGVQPMVCWLDVYHIDLVLDVFAPCSNSVQNLASSAQQRGRHSWRLNRYAACKTILTKPYSDSSNSSSSIGVAPGSYPGAVKRRQRVARRQHHDVDYYGYDGYNTCATYNYDTSFLANQNVNNNNFSMNVYWNQKYGMEVDQNQKYGMAVNRNQKGGSLRSQRLETSRASNASACVDKTPNWEEQHDVMMSVCMEKVPPRFAEDWLAVVCPVAKRRIVVAYLGSTCSYNKLGHVDRKFQSRLPGGNTHSVQVIESNDMCILDCLHLKAERTFYVLDIMFWKQFPYYQSDAEFRFNWIRDKFTDSFYTKLSSDNQYMFKPLFQFPCTKEDIVKVVRETTFKVDGLLFFYRLGWYTPGVSANVLWLRPENMHSILGLQQSEDLSPDVKLSRCDGSRDSTCNTSGVDVRSDDSGSNMCNTSGADVKSDDSRSNTCAASGVDIRFDDSGSNMCNTSGVDIRSDDSGSNVCNTRGVDIRSDDSGSNMCNTSGVDIRSDDSGSNMCNTSGVDIRSDDSGSNMGNTSGVDIRSDDSGSSMCNTSGVDIRSDDSRTVEATCNTSGVDILST